MKNSNLSEIQIIFSLNIATLIIELNKRGYQCTFGEVARTPEQQEIYVKTGKSKTMLSAHINRLAADINLFKDGVYLTEAKEYKVAAETWEALNENNVAGFSWGWDANHFEMKMNPRPVSNLQSIINPVVAKV
jgi:hypothetical protein